jgi:hypothetical protein
MQIIYILIWEQYGYKEIIGSYLILNQQMVGASDEPNGISKSFFSLVSVTAC